MVDVEKVGLESANGQSVAAVNEKNDRTDVAHLKSSIPVLVCRRILSIPRQHAYSLDKFTRELANQLKANHASLTISDKYDTPINDDLDLKSAIVENRAPLQASLKISALRELEQRRGEAESKKEELSQFQWQLLVDEISAVSKQVAVFAGQLHQVQDDCKDALVAAKREWELKLVSLDCKIDRQNSVAETNVKDFDLKLQKVLQAICSERSAREVAVHNLHAQVTQLDAKIEADRMLRSQERAEFERRVDALALKVESHSAMAKQQWDSYAKAMARTDASLEELNFSDSAMNKRLNDIEVSSDRILSDLSNLSNSLSMYQRQTQEMVGRRAEELNQAVRDEVVGRESHIARLAQELEASQQILESRLQRGREEASKSIAQFGELVRVTENRVLQLEKDAQLAVNVQNDAAKMLARKIEAMSPHIDGMQISMQSNDVVVQTTAAKVGELCKRMEKVESECNTKITAEYWMPHANSMERVAAKLDEKLEVLQKDVSEHFEHAASYRESIKREMQDMLKSYLDGLRKMPAFQGVSPSNSNGSATPRPYAMPLNLQEPLRTNNGAIKTGAQQQSSPTKVVIPSSQRADVRTTGATPASVKAVADMVTSGHRM